jgi:hypothetical protein
MRAGFIAHDIYVMRLERQPSHRESQAPDDSPMGLLSFQPVSDLSQDFDESRWNHVFAPLSRGWTSPRLRPYVSCLESILLRISLGSLFESFLPARRF